MPGAHTRNMSVNIHLMRRSGPDERRYWDSRAHVKKITARWISVKSLISVGAQAPGPGPHPDVLIRDNLFALDAHLNEINDYSTVGAWTQWSKGACSQAGWLVCMRMEIDDLRMQDLYVSCRRGWLKCFITQFK